MQKHHWINDEVTIDFPIPRSIQNVIHELERFDEAEDYGYFGYVDAIDSAAKEMYVRGVLTHKQWDTLCLKYEGCYTK